MLCVQAVFAWVSMVASGRRGSSACILLALATGAAHAQSGTALETARAHAAAGRAGAAVRDFDAWIREHPLDGAAMREAATYAFRERRWFDAARWLERYVALRPDDPSGWYDLGALRYNQCRFDLAIPVFRQLASLEASDASLALRAEHRFLHGESARRLERYGEAAAELEVAVARAPDRADYRKALAQALFDAGRFGAAASAFAEAVRLDPSAENHYGLGAALAEEGRVDEALAALREARRIGGRDPRVLHKLAVLSLRTQDLRRAESYLVEAQSVAPRNVEILFTLAQVQRLQGHAAEAAETRALADEVRAESDAAIERGRVYSRTLISRPDDVDAHVDYGIDLLTQRRFEEAQVILQRLLSFDPRNELAIVNLTSLLARQGDAAGALREIGKLLDDDPGHPTANLQAARIRMSLGKPAEARRHAALALEREPGSREARELMAAILRALGDEEGAARQEAALREETPESRPGGR